MKTLKEIFAEIGHFGEDIGCNDKGGTHSYLESYDNLLEPYRNKSIKFLEIGLALGDSLKLFDQYFYASTLYGVDISVVFPTPVRSGRNSIVVVEGDATKEEVIEAVSGDLGFDVVIDDGSHMEADQVASFNLLKGKMKPGGIYIIEDILALDQNAERFKALHDNCEIIDLRHVKGRFDDVLIVYRF